MKRYFVSTYGCQMNVRDSEIIAEQLASAGYAPSADAASADVIVINTCSVRDKAEQKLYSELGRYRRRTPADRRRTLVVAGCVAQQERQRIMSRAPFVDVVLGTHQVRDLLSHLAAARDGAVVATAWKHGDPQARLGAPDHAPVRSPSAYVTIQEGCDNVCTFCVVPLTRGREVSRPAAAVLDEVRMHADRGVKEIVLLGQNVNSYGAKFAGFPRFAELLARVAAVGGIARIRFTAPHPKDYDDDLIAAYRDLDKLCPSAHLPLQSGSPRVLAAMRRGYDRDKYLEIVARLRRARPDLDVSTDLIVGFPGETAADFQETMTALERVRFAQVYAFVYSPRPGTAARSLPDSTPPAEKRERLQTLLARQREIQAADHQRYVGAAVPVLFTAARGGLLAGRSPQGRMVHAAGDEHHVGKIADVVVERASANALYGSLAGESIPRETIDGRSA